MSGKIVAIEGLWNIGKTSLCRNLVKDIRGAKLINEPDHKKSKSEIQDIQSWYLRAWYQKMKSARKLASQDRVVLMERSFFSTQAFVKALGRSVTPEMRLYINQLKNDLPDMVVLLKSQDHLSASIEKNKVRGYRNSGIPITNMPFLQRYESALRDSIIQSGVAWIEVDITKTPEGLHSACQKIKEALEP